MWLERCPQAELRGRPIPGCGCTTPIHILLVAAAALSMSFQCVTSYFSCWCRKISRSWKGALFFSQFEDTAHYVGKGVAARHLITLNLQPKGRDECFPLSLLSSPPLFLLFLFFFLLLLLPPPLPSLLFFFFHHPQSYGPSTLPLQHSAGTFSFLFSSKIPGRGMLLPTFTVDLTATVNQVPAPLSYAYDSWVRVVIWPFPKQ